MWSLEQDKLSILTMLMLRGIQTAGEIRSRAGRMHEFKTVAEVEAGLQFLIDKYPPLVARLARAPGTKEPRYVHLLAGDEILAQQEIAAGAILDVVTQSSRLDRVTQLEQEVSSLRCEVDRLAKQFDDFKKQFE
jgi:hypothetical protein